METLKSIVRGCKQGILKCIPPITGLSFLIGTFLLIISGDMYYGIKLLFECIEIGIILSIISGAILGSIMGGFLSQAPPKTLVKQIIYFICSALYGTVLGSVGFGIYGFFDGRTKTIMSSIIIGSIIGLIWSITLCFYNIYRNKF